MNVGIVGADAVATTSSSGSLGDEVQACVGMAKLYTVSAFNNTAGDLYLLVYDTASTPGLTDYPRLCTVVYAGLSGGFGFTDGALFLNGIYVCLSSATQAATLTGSGTDGIIDVTYRKA